MSFILDKNYFGRLYGYSFNDSFLNECLSDLDLKKGNLTSTQYDWALKTLSALQILEANSLEFSVILDEFERHSAITKKTGLVAEQAFTKGDTSTQIMNSIVERLKEVQEIYHFDKRNDNTQAFFRDGFIGPPCFNGRLLTLREYHQNQHLHTEFTSSSLKSTKYDKEACLIEEIIYELQKKSNSDKIPSQEVVKNHLLKNGFSLVNNFEAVYLRALDIMEGGDL